MDGNGVIDEDEFEFFLPTYKWNLKLV